MLKVALSACAFALLGSGAIAAPADPALPPNTIDCRDFTHNPDGSWTAHANAKPFTLGALKDMTIRSSTFSGGIVMGEYDLAMVLSLKCGSAAR